MMVRSASTLQPQSIPMFLALSRLLDFDLCTSNVRQAYLQWSEALTWDIFIRQPVLEVELKPSRGLKLLKPLYGLYESGDLWHATLDRHHRLDLKMTPLRSTTALYISMENEVLRGLLRAHVDDLARTRNKEFKVISQNTKGKFCMAEDQSPPCSLTVFHYHLVRMTVCYRTNMSIRES